MSAQSRFDAAYCAAPFVRVPPRRHFTVPEFSAPLGKERLLSYPLPSPADSEPSF